MQNPEINVEYIEYFLTLLKDSFNSIVIPSLTKWIGLHKVAVVLDFNVDAFYKNQLKDYLLSICGATKVTYYTFKDLKAQRDNGDFHNLIPESKVILLSLLNHCTGKNWAIYPNSFDQFCLNPGQSVRYVVNRIVFEPRYSWVSLRLKTT